MFGRLKKIVGSNTDRLSDLAEIAAPGDKNFFVGAQFSGADLADTNLSDFSLRGASFIGAQMNSGTILHSDAEVTLSDLSRELGQRSRELFDEVESVVSTKVEPSKNKLRRFMRVAQAPEYAERFGNRANATKKAKSPISERKEVGNELIWNIFSCISEIESISAKAVRPRVSDVMALKRSADRINALCEPHVERASSVDEQDSDMKDEGSSGVARGPIFGMRYHLWAFFEDEDQKRYRQIKKELQEVSEGIEKIEKISAELAEMLPLSVQE